MKNRVISQDFYLNDDVVAIAKALLGKFLVTKIGNTITTGMIVETEAYCAPQDKASHAYNYRYTARTQTMYLQGGVAYIYLCYGMHHLFNIVTAEKGIPHAVLVRAIEPIDGIPLMLKRRQIQLSYKLTAGPGVLTQALGISKTHNGTRLTSESNIWLEERNVRISKKDILATARVGIDYAQEWKTMPWRFRLRNNPWTSKA